MDTESALYCAQTLPRCLRTRFPNTLRRQELASTKNAPAGAVKYRACVGGAHRSTLTCALIQPRHTPLHAAVQDRTPKSMGMLPTPPACCTAIPPSSTSSDLSSISLAALSNPNLWFSPSNNDFITNLRTAQSIRALFLVLRLIRFPKIPFFERLDPEWRAHLLKVPVVFGLENLRPSTRNSTTGQQRGDGDGNEDNCYGPPDCTVERNSTCERDLREEGGHTMGRSIVMAGNLVGDGGATTDALVPIVLDGGVWV
ncbi:hypothetical protein IW261DRAFT_1422600 [Armillaria novae-zelandiae]|uniref:Uncharacterized protein n=1 Tax=Armillaria novae-zelandiae TaxID=153914 RepID=A0AA39P0I6_9AGAR|nr:hypothetical protein IW261DRAFT_1422600 [Armillaria novae-zelandiae]